MGFFLAYLFTVAAVLGVVSSFVTVVSSRNRAVTMVAQLFSIIANPLATIAHHLRSSVAIVLDAIPETAFGPGVMRRLLYGLTFIVLLAVDFSLSAGRLAVAFGVAGEQLPIDIGWLAALGWVACAGLFGAASLELRGEAPGHPWDQLTESARVLCRRLSDVMLIVVALSGVLFYAWGALAAAGSYPLLPVVVFMSALGLALIVASALAFWCSQDAWATLWGVLLVVASIALRVVGLLPEMLVIGLCRTACLVMATIDLPALGVALPLLQWLAGSRLGKALGIPRPEAPIAWPPVGVPEPAGDSADANVPDLVLLDRDSLEDEAA